MIGEWNNGTGRRKSSVARVFLKKGYNAGHGQRQGHQCSSVARPSIMICRQPVLTNVGDV
jgi:small subunit ribosomal protein S9